MLHALIAMVATIPGAISQQDNFPNPSPWSSEVVKKAFTRPVFHDEFVNGKINRLSRNPWNRAQSALALFMAVRENEALNRAKTPEQADKVVRATINGWTRVLTYHQTLYLWHTIYQFDDYYSGDPFWKSVGNEEWEAKEIGGLSLDQNGKLPPVAITFQWTKSVNTPIAKDRIRFDDEVADYSNNPHVSGDRATLGISVNDRGILQFQENSLLTYAYSHKAPWSADMNKAARQGVDDLEKALSTAQKVEAERALSKFEADIEAALRD